MKKCLPILTVLLLLTRFTFAGNLPYTGHYFINSGMTLSFYADQPEFKIEIYPNPVTEGVLNITTEKNIQIVQIMNITGKIVFTQEYQPNTTSVTIELDNVEKGVYLVRIGFTDKVIHTEKIMVK